MEESKEQTKNVLKVKDNNECLRRKERNPTLK